MTEMEKVQILLTITYIIGGMVSPLFYCDSDYYDYNNSPKLKDMLAKIVFWPLVFIGVVIRLSVRGLINYVKNFFA